MSDKSLLVAIAQRFLQLIPGRMHPEVARGVQIADTYTPAVSGDWTSVPSTQDEALDTIAADFTALAGDVSTAEGDISDLQGDLSDLQGDVSDITPTHKVIAAGIFTTVGGDATETITATGADATCIAIVTPHTVPGSAVRTIVTAACGTDVVTLTLDDDPSTTHKFNYTVLKALT